MRDGELWLIDRQVKLAQAIWNVFPAIALLFCACFQLRTFSEVRITRAFLAHNCTCKQAVAEEDQHKNDYGKRQNADYHRFFHNAGVHVLLYKSFLTILDTTFKYYSLQN